MKKFTFNNFKLIFPDIKKFIKERMDAVEKDKYKMLMHDIGNFSSDVTMRIFFGQSLDGKSIKGEPVANHILKVLVETNIFASKDPNLALQAIFFGKYYHSLMSAEGKRFNKEMQDVIKFFLDLVEGKIQKFTEEYEKTKDITKVSFEENVVDFAIEQILREKYQIDFDPSNKITVREIVGSFINFFVAGLDATAATGTWCLLKLADKKDCLKKV